MSFAARSLGQDAAPGPINPLGLQIPSDVQSGAPSSASVTYNTNGTITRTGNNGSGPSAWYNPTGGTPGNSYWIKFTLTSGSAWASPGFKSSCQRTCSCTSSPRWLVRIIPILLNRSQAPNRSSMLLAAR